jgi:hypothetical protein
MEVERHNAYEPILLMSMESFNRFGIWFRWDTVLIREETNISYAYIGRKSIIRNVPMESNVYYLDFLFFNQALPNIRFEREKYLPFLMYSRFD